MKKRGSGPLRTADKLRKSFDGSDSLSKKSDLDGGNFDLVQKVVLPLSRYNQLERGFGSLEFQNDGLWRKRMFINRYLIGFIRSEEREVIKTCLLQLLLTMLGTGAAFCAALAVRMLQGRERIFVFSSPWQAFAAILLFLLLRFRLSKERAAAAERCGLRIKASLRETLLKKLFSLGPAYAAKSRTGDIAATISTKVDFLTEYYTIYLPSAVSSIVNAVLIILLISSWNLPVAAVTILSFAGLMISPMLFYALMRERGVAEMRAFAEYYSDCLDSLQGMAALKAFNANQEQKQRIFEKGEELRRATMGQLAVTMIENVVLQFFAGLGSAFSLAVAAYQQFQGGMSGAQLLYTLFLIGACFAPMQVLIQAWHMGYRGISASEAVSRLLEESASHCIRSFSAEAPRLSASETSIRFEKVSFAYNQAEGEVLQEISFQLPAQTTTALVGVSGSGKSTIAQLLAGFYPAGRGRICIGDVPLSEESGALLQQNIAAVWQDAHMFYGTAEENIRIGKPEATEEEVREAAKKASIHAFIETLPQGYQTMIGERGMRFSGGERQRLALARAFLRDAPILILDEATSSLDRENEILIQESLRRLSQGRTTLIIAHRLATIEKADRILVMQRGRVLEQGSHQELLRSSEIYRRLMGDQLGREQRNTKERTKERKTAEGGEAHA